MQKILFLLLPCLFVFSGLTAKAAVSPLSVSIIPPIEFPASDFNVAGLRASVLWGHHRNVYGVDLGVLGNVTDQVFTGLGIAGGFNLTKGTTTITGLQFAGLTNWNMGQTNIYGLQLALLLNSNQGASSVYGLQFALLNLSPYTSINGFQVGLYNRANTVRGFQFGLVNVASNLHGIQIGLLNFNQSGPFAVSPILNAGF